MRPALQVMGKAVDSPEHPAAESKRLSGLVGGKMSDDKRAAMQVGGCGGAGGCRYQPKLNRTQCKRGGRGGGKGRGWAAVGGRATVAEAEGGGSPTV